MPKRSPPTSSSSIGDSPSPLEPSKHCANRSRVRPRHSRTCSSTSSGSEPAMLRRELAIVFRARVTWVQAALSALLVGHSFVLAIDLYSAGSRSAQANRLMSREFDPLLGIVRPTLGGLYV